MAREDLIGKVVALTGNNEVGYGAKNGTVKGIVISVVADDDSTGYEFGYDGNGNSGSYNLSAATKTAIGETGSIMVGVEWGVMKEGVAISATAAEQPAAGDFVAVDGAGGVVKIASATAGTARCESVNTAARTCTITIL